jgi:hypothetical protein
LLDGLDFVEEADVGYRDTSDLASLNLVGSIPITVVVFVPDTATLFVTRCVMG